MRRMRENSIVVLSGGMDSATVLGKLMDIKQGYTNSRTNCVFFEYNQHTQKKERECAEALCKHYDVDLIVHQLKLHSEGLVSDGEDFEVPARNSIFALMCLNIGKQIYKNEEFDIFLGIQGSDQTTYVDCTELAIDMTAKLVGYLSTNNATVYAPFSEISKAEILKIGIALGVPYEKTWSCYVSQEKPCGECPSCKLRKEGFINAGMQDPLEKKYGEKENITNTIPNKQ